MAVAFRKLGNRRAVSRGFETPLVDLVITGPSRTMAVTEGSVSTDSLTITISAASGTLGTSSISSIEGVGGYILTASIVGHVVTVTALAGSAAPGSYTPAILLANTAGRVSPIRVPIPLTVASATLPATAQPAILPQWGAGVGTYRIVTGVPLIPGAMTPTEVRARKFSLWKDGVEVPIHCEDPDYNSALFPDNATLRGVTIHFDATFVDATPQAYAFRTDVVRTTTDLAFVQPSANTHWVPQTPGPSGTNARPMPKLLPTDPDYLCQTDWALIPLVPAASQTAGATARFDTLATARALALDVNTVNRTSFDETAFKSTYEVPQGLIATYCRVGATAADLVEMALRRGYRMLEYVFPAPSYGGVTPNPNVYGESRFTQTTNSGWPEAFSLRLLSYAACFRISAYPPFHTRINMEHQRLNSALKAVPATAITINGTSGYITSAYGIRTNIREMWPHVIAYATRANRRTTATSGLGNRDMAMPAELPNMLEALLQNPWATGDWRDGVTGLHDGNTDGGRNGGPQANAFPTFQLAIVNSFYLFWLRQIDKTELTRVLAAIKINADVAIKHTRLLTAADNLDANGGAITSGYPIATYGYPYWCGTFQAGEGLNGGGDASSFTMGMHLPSIGLLARLYPATVVNGATYGTWYTRYMDASNNLYHNSVAKYDWDRFSNGWKVWGEMMSDAQQAEAHLAADQFASAPTAIVSLPVPTVWPR